MVRERMLSDEQWERIKAHVPRRPPSRKGGRPRADDRACLEGILWILKTGARWKDLPPEYPSPSTCWRRLVQWEADGTLKAIWRAFLETLDEARILSWREVFMDATFTPAKKGASMSAKPSGARDRSFWYWPMARVFLWEAIPRLPRPRR